MHGALSVAVYLDNPPADPNTDALIVYFSTKNMRGKFKEEWSRRNDYPGYALGMTPVCIPASGIAVAMSGGEKNAVLAAGRLTKTEYGLQSSYAATGTAVVKSMEVILAGLKSGPPYVGNGFTPVMGG